MPYAEVCVNVPSRQRRTYSYSVPKGIELSVGDMVWVPFGARTLQGLVFELGDVPDVEFTKDIISVIDSPPGLLPHQVALAQWISDYYLCPLFEAASLMLAPGAERGSSLLLTPALFGEDPTALTLPALQRSILDIVLEKGVVGIEDLKRDTGRKNLSAAISSLVKAGLIERTYSLDPQGVRPKTVRLIRLAHRIGDQGRRLGDKQKEVVAFLLEAMGQEVYREVGGLVPVHLVCSRTGATASTIRSLEQHGVIEVIVEEVMRDPLRRLKQFSPEEVILTDSQRGVWERVRLSLSENSHLSNSLTLSNLDALPPAQRVFLLHGVTGSGKTEIFLRALDEAVAQGKQGIVMVPEISMTPQTIQRFHARFPGRTAILHSRLSAGERFDEWRRIRRGDVDLVVGPRSAVFAPVVRPAVVIIDEEHEWTYKSDVSPHYHAREVALRLSLLTGATLILGSATPDIESYHRARNGAYTLLELPERVSPRVAEGESGTTSAVTELPRVELVDLRSELRAGNTSIFSRSLNDAIVRALSLGEQIILFLNRRGTSSIVMCRDCGYVVRCKRCDLPLTFHQVEDNLVCHLCNRRTTIPNTCPKCSSRRIRYLGIGTQKVEEETAKAFPSARLLRWDSDVTGTKYAHEEILEKFVSHQADILIGTQMIAKGLNLPLVTLVGVINADIGLHLPDFRSGERTFQLLTQVAGRAGRGRFEGKVIVQTYTPEHYAVKAASRHDYESFYGTEIRYRRERSNPPFGRLVRLTYTNSNSLAAQKEARRIGSILRKAIASLGLGDIALLGPTPAFVSRLRGRYRWQLILRGANPHRLLSELVLPPGWQVDVDPASLL